jgi:hypothetical protein
VHADVLDAVLERQLAALAGDLLVVHPPRVAADVLVDVIADRIAVDRFGLSCVRSFSRFSSQLGWSGPVWTITMFGFDLRKGQP